jgi:ribonuclease HII
MCDFSVKYPEYGFAEHKGYGTKKHEQALMNYGITPIHRKSYAPIKRLLSRESWLI